MLAAVLLLAAAPSVTLGLSDRSEVRVRDSNEPTGVALDLETAPAATLRLDDRRWTLDATYAPRLSARAVRTAPAYDALHRGILGVSFRLRNLRLTVSEDVSYGFMSFASLVMPATTGTELPRIDALPRAQTILFLGSRTSYVASARASRRWVVTSTLEYTLSGGADEAARAVLPRQAGPSLEEDAEYRASRRDTLTSGFGASRVVFSSGPEDTLFETTETWRHAFDPALEGGLRGGTVLAVTRPNGAAELGASFHPLAELWLRRDLHEVTWLAAAHLMPVVDRLTGAVDERLIGTLACGWTFAPRLAVRAEGGLAHSVPFDEPAALTLAMGELVFRVAASDALRFELGTRSAWQAQRGVEPGPPQWVGFLGATFAPRPLRL